MCYDINGDNMLQLIPISETNIEKAFYLSINDLDYFAHKATTLTPFDAWQEVDGYNEALFEYMQSIKYNDKDLFTKYDKLIHAQRGSELLKYGTKEECIDEAKRCLEDFAPGGGYIFTTDKFLLCGDDAKIENLAAVNEYVHVHGKY